jgi:hypothetical protein
LPKYTTLTDLEVQQEFATIGGGKCGSMHAALNTVEIRPN